MFSPILQPKLDNTLMAIIRDLGLTTNLKLCLDAGDPGSYTSGQKWLDRSGNGHDFHLGADSSATSTDPAFNGTPGAQSANEYFSGDGGDYFTYDANSETWMRDFHKAGAITALGIVYVPSDATVVLANTITAGATHGFCVYYSATLNKFVFFITNSSGSTVAIASAAPDVAIPSLNFVAFSTTIGTGNAYTIFLNGTAYSGNWPSFTPSTTSALTNPMHIGATDDLALTSVTGTRWLGQALWDDAALSDANLLAIYNRLKLRYPTLP